MTYIANQHYAILHPRGDTAQAGRIYEPEGCNAVEGKLVIAPLKTAFTLTAFALTALFAGNEFTDSALYDPEHVHILRNKKTKVDLPDVS